MTSPDGADRRAESLRDMVARAEASLGRAIETLRGRGAPPEEALCELRRARDELGVVERMFHRREGGVRPAPTPAGVARDVRGALNTVAGWAQLLGLDDVSAATVRRASQVIERNVRRLVRLADAMGRGEAGSA
jgi:hypothetical protein